ncbi:MAG: hypothetical protein H6594_05870 [Flavobacteriales bacterium]|nr:hypothetical protein [Flavobacteriales bacterium]
MVDRGHLNELARIRGLMDRSSRFLSLSGWSGIIAGVAALLGAVAARAHYLSIGPGVPTHDAWREASGLMERLGAPEYSAHLRFLIADAVLVLLVTLIGAWWTTRRRGRRIGQPLWDASGKRLALNLAIPLLTGGGFSLALLWHDLVFLIPPSTLIFYGLALLNASKYTLDEVRWLGLCELFLGLVACFRPDAGLLFWAIGFGVLHIVYGAMMYLRHERA